MSQAPWADAVLITHVLYVSIVVFSVPVIIIGGVCRWKWVRNIWFRSTHLFMIAVVVAESLLGINCPLTVWERELRQTDGPTIDGNQDFIASRLDGILFYHFPHGVFTAAYILFGILVASLFFIVPVKHNHFIAPQT